MATPTFRIFQGHETNQICGITGAAAMPNEWYWEPADYDGDTLWSVNFDTKEEALRAAERESAKPQATT